MNKEGKMGELKKMTENRKFEGGRLLLSSGVSKTVAQEGGSKTFVKFIINSLDRHFSGDWGDMSADDKQENEFSLDKYLRIFSAYIIPDRLDKGVAQEKIWIITEADRSATTVLFPEEY